MSSGMLAAAKVFDNGLFHRFKGEVRIKVEDSGEHFSSECQLSVDPDLEEEVREFGIVEGDLRRRTQFSEASQIERARMNRPM